ncbi:uncharacterized protein LY89DRAFT_644340 [Mollisia scopiformis]|uniref:Uncharacterized protein n=1 Tax=Mollisia scopiformis TaxID=149040 RepID=A0A194XDM2_MOLSC|nr:uncharacterized protein LY89DRAFT_644340 [Mollisia scopiformis]KUJ18280.1 hypothetical protein LY89DRAFT_644340 [Mollisia scopiformis]
MGLANRVSTSWVNTKIERTLGSSRASVLRTVLLVGAGCLITYLLLLPLFYLFSTFTNFSSQTRFQSLIHEPGEDTIEHFAGSRDCGITQADIYDAPWPTSPNASPFCKNRATLLEALSGGGRHGFDEPYVGKGCTYRWFPTPEICMILERLNAIVFVGDDVSRSIYAAFNVLFREDLVLGSLQEWLMTEEDRMKCKCDNQFIDSQCQAFAIKSRDEVKKSESGDRKGTPYFCERVPHAYIPVDTVPTSAASQTLFKELMYSKPNPWQPSPMIFSFGHGSSFDVSTTTRALDEWTSLATAAERNIPMLFLGSPAFSLSKSTGTAPDKGNLAVWQYLDEMSPVAKEKHFDVLSLYNLTLQASTADGESFGEKVALVEAMMIINWLSKLETS